MKEITGCLHPGQCYVKAQQLLNSRQNKWDPRVIQPEDYEEDQAPNNLEDPDTMIFDPRVTTVRTLADAFRIFTEGYENAADTAPNTKFAAIQAPRIEVYTDGSALHNNTDNVKAGAGNTSPRGTRALKPSWGSFSY
jgi:hypothetical protein